ncbi:6-hydroxymethylpterin diphosphokinase MptE-like protein [Shewanella baltica]|uniref:6-hydroxymethylpterin diphosphokinase MptE-like protein n=1 Tax=Shewanella baltica TaxID=62322 RepID=UPI0021699626|nr:6-hydroxymethylpterin diphosphokinase MptE-like protein [Shewanella baltica]MCS6113388.1 motility associated factor glycosyltransferase family protein [Shewanella baltica]UVW64788.1 motility associated factor glycosyltransferase family protein [Shewanella baltica]
MQLQTNISNNFAISPFNEYYLPSINRHTFESIDSRTIYNKKFKQSFASQDKLNIVVGLDSGLLANYILEQDIAIGSKFIFVELDEVLPLLVIDIPSVQEKHVKIVNELEFIELLKKEDIQLYIAKGKYEVYASLGVSSLHLDAYTTLLNRIENKIQDEYFNYSISFNQKIFFQTQLENIPDNKTPAKILKDTFKGKTCLIVAGGPSLDEHISWIKENNKNIFIIAVSRIAGKLAKNSISIDIITCVDPQEFSFDVSREIFTLSENTLLVNSYHICPKILSQWHGQSVYLGQKYPWFNSNDHDNIITVGPTVTNSSIRLAIEMGFNRILLSGVDYCYSRSGYSHANGTVEANLGPTLGRNNKWVETYAGYQAETPIQLIHAMDALTDEVKNYPNVDFINLSANAAKIDCINHIKTNDIVLDKFGSKKKPTSIFNNIEENRKNLILSLNECNEKKETFNKILKLTKKALALTKKLSTNTLKSKVIINKINKIEDEINSENSIASKIIKTYGYFEFSKFLTTRETETWTQSHINQMTTDYYEAFSNICHDMLKLITQACGIIEFRILEIDSNSLIQLAPTWFKDKQPGRSTLWYNKNKILNEVEDKIYSKLKNKFNEDITQVRNEYVNILKSVSSMECVYKKIIGLNSNKNSYGLSLTVQNLFPLIESDDEAKRLYYLALSFQLSLEQQPQQALDALLALPEELCTEMELKHIILLALKLSKLELATATLVKILAHSDEYMPQYAHILKLQGKIQESVNVYLDYLEKYPSDTQTWIKLGLFMFEINQVEASHTAFSNAINADPDNQVAREYLAELTRLMNTPQ